MLDLCRRHLKCPIEGLVSPEHSKVRPEHHKRPTNCIDGGLREIPSVLEFGIANLKFLVDCGQFFIGGLEFLFGAFQLLVETLQLLV